MLLKLSAIASVRGWYSFSGFLLELHLALHGLSGASRRIRKEAKASRSRPRPRVELIVPATGGEGR